MSLPTLIETEKLLHDAERRNPGSWIGHSNTAAFCAKAISEHCDNLDADTAYIFGLLHDICITRILWFKNLLGFTAKSRNPKGRGMAEKND